MFEKFIEYNNELYAFNLMKVTKIEGECLTIFLNNDFNIKVTGSKTTLPMKYNVLKEFLDTGLVYNKLHNVLSFEDLNKPDTFNTDGVYRGELLVNAQIIRNSRLKIDFHNHTNKTINLRKTPFWQFIKDSTECYITPYELCWKTENNVTITLNVQDIIALPSVIEIEEQTIDLQERIDGLTDEVKQIPQFQEQIKDTTIDAYEIINKSVFNPVVPKRKPRAASKEKVDIDLNS